MENLKTKISPKEIFEEYKSGNDYKSSIGTHGIYEQAKINERFYVGDQWYGVNLSNQRPLARRNLIKRIGDFKMSSVGAAPIAVNYSADGIPNTVDMQESIQQTQEQMINGEMSGVADNNEIAVITAAMSDYFRVTAERLKFESKKDQLLKNAYISGTTIGYTYWDSDINTGLYADESRTQPIKGDIAFEVLDVENVIFGDPNSDDLQAQPFIIMSQRKDIAAVKREARKYKQNTEAIKPDGAGDNYNSGDRGDQEPAESRRVTVLTKLFKEYDENGDYKVYAVKVCENAVVRPKWDLCVRLYPIAVFRWDNRRSSAYGDSEITYFIANQIAVNRALTAEIWATMLTGMPKMVVNGDTVDSITNEPGEIIKVYGTNEDVAGAIHYVSPPNFGSQLLNSINDLSNNTLTDAGANDAALGTIKPDNATAIMQVREAALQPMQMYQNRFYDFIEDIARIWADFWINLYGKRSLRIEDKTGVWFLPFDAERYKNLVFTARIDVGASTVWSAAVVVNTLNNLLANGLITLDQYLERIPKGIIPDVTGLREDIKAQQSTGGDISDEEILANLQQQDPEMYAQLMQLPPEQQQQILADLKGGGQAQPQQGFETMEVGDL